MYKKILSVIILLGFATTNIFSQATDDFTALLKLKNKGKTYTVKSENNISERTYLGKITLQNPYRKYYVVKEFYKVKAAIVYHGHSRILFFDNKLKLAYQAILGAPNELPEKVSNNDLYLNTPRTIQPRLFNTK